MTRRSVLIFFVFVFTLLAPKLTFATAEDHVFYLGTNQHVYDVWWLAGQDANAPTVWDATQLASAPIAAAGGGLAAYIIGNEIFCYFVTNTDHLGLLYYASGAWHYDDLTSMAGAPAPVIGTTPLVGFNIGNTPYVYYQYGTSPCVAEVYGTGSNVWAWDSPSSLAGAPACESKTPLAAFTISSERLLYYSDGSDVHELYNTGAGWVHVNVTQTAGAPAMLSNTSLTGFSYGLQAHVYYAASTGPGLPGYVTELYSNNGSPWTYTKIDFSEEYGYIPPLIPLASYSYASEYHVLFAFYTSCASGECVIAESYAPVNTENWVTQGAGPSGVGPNSRQPGPIVGHNNTDSNTEHYFFVSSIYANCVGQSWSVAGSDTWQGTEPCYSNAPTVAPTSQMASAHY